MKSEPCSERGMCVYPTRANAFIKVQGVDFGKGAKSFTASVASTARDGKIELRLDSPDGPLIGTCLVPAAGDTAKWETTSCRVKPAAGVRDLYFLFTSGEATMFDWWKSE